MKQMSSYLPIAVLLLLILSAEGLAAGVPSMELERLQAAGGARGGIAVHLGCGDGRSTASLLESDCWIVHGLDQDAAEVRRARSNLTKIGVHGRVSVDLVAGPTLPYVDNLVNLMIAEAPGPISEPEILRVLAPGGVGFIKDSGRWKEIVKPRPENIDEWTHFLHDAGNNAVARDDLVGPPRRLKWVAPPRWLRSHETPSGIQAMVSGAGRIFYILDEGPIGITDERLPDRWAIVARDAWNGKWLWERPLKEWGWRQWALQKWQGKDWTKIRGGRGAIPPDNQRRLVVAGDRLYATLSFDAPLSVLDAATGETLTTVAATEGTREILVHGDRVILRLEQASPGLAVIDAGSARILWKRENVRVPAGFMAAAGGSLYLLTGKSLVSLSIQDGKEVWRATPQAGNVRTLVAREEAVLLLSSESLASFDAASGKPLWRTGVSPRQGAEAADLFVIDGLVWAGMAHVFDGRKQGRRSEDARAVGRDIRTGKVAKEILARGLRSPEHHHRCYRNKATSRYIISSQEGAEFLDLASGRHRQSNWVRGACVLGMMPANGMLYAPADQCFCSPGAKLPGFTALMGSEESTETLLADGARLTKGRAYGSQPAAAPVSPGESEGWPTFRADVARKGAVSTTVPVQVSEAWERTLGGVLTQPTAWRGKLYVVRRDTNTLHALDLASGRSLWTFPFPGPVDSPPTIYRGFVLVGARDGRAYCLRASDGELVWRFLAAPRDRRICAYDRLESVWPAHGSVLVDSGVAYVAAGRSTYLDGGIFLYGLHIPTGEIIHRGRLEGPHWESPERGKSFFSLGANSDILVAEGGFIYMRQKKLTRELEEVRVPVLSSKGAQDVGLHVFSTSGLLDDSCYNRAFWMYGRRWPGFQLAGQAPKSGQLLVVDDETTYAVKVFYRRNVHSPMFFPGRDGYLLYADKNTTEPQIYGEEGTGKPLAWLPQSGYDRGAWAANAGEGTAVPLDQFAFGFDKGIGYTRAVPALWQFFLPIRIRAMVKTESVLFVAGAPDILDSTDPLAAFEDRRGAILAAVSPSEGKEMARVKLESPPVFDGMIAAYGRLFLSLRNGKVICLAGE